MFIGYLNKFLRCLGCSVLILVLTIQPTFMARAQMPLSRPLVNQIIADLVLDQFLEEYSRLKTFSDFGEWLVKHFPARDHDFIKKNLSSKRKLPKLDRLNRGLALTIEKEKYTLEIVNASLAVLRFNGLYTWTYNPNSPLRTQFEVFKRALERKRVSSIDLFLPKAHAAAWVWPIVAFFVGAGLNPVTQDVVTKLAYPWLKSYYCDDRTPQTSYHSAEFCDSYFKWKEANRAKLPAAETVPDSTKAVEQVELKTKCRSADDPDIVTEVESPDKTIKTKRTIKFGSGNRPTQVIEELVKPPSELRLIYTLDEKSGIVMVESKCGANGDEKCPENKAVFLSRKKEHMDLMTSEKIKAIDKFEESLKTIIPVIEQCDAKAKAVVKKSEEPGVLLSTKVKEVEEGKVLEEEKPASKEKSVR